jgi:ribosomal protein S18 acetylase RimI-like enzyme
MRVELRTLTPADAADFHALRLRSLRESPEAFGSSHDEEQHVTLQAVAQRLEASRTPTARIVLGAWADDVLVGVVGCVQESRAKARHKAVIWGMYVAPEARGQGVGRALLERAVAEARTWPNVARLTLSVVERGEAARALYRSVGFEPYAREADAFRQNGRSDAVEFMSLELGASTDGVLG